ncbi:2-isopropylmalate synthase [Roseimicrobium gellanilyticum]|uniref:Citramalate synthase n=1 Tax=Roseimicrobium gellanilyticum TaxID=748857 RepID=A0A366HFP7_9BACT|nr:citramalate synthase [Roseimicrobium gellanilyticum]RBP40504.1 2-isopropylmalate synthase [Roseimicrobium gellanilyticum]
MSKSPAVSLYDTTLRDGTQGEGVNFSAHDKLRIAHELDAFGMHYIEGGWPGSNPKDMEFFELAKTQKFKNAKIAAFGSTRRANLAVEDDPQVKMLIDAGTPVVTFYGKSWLLHVTEVLRTTPEENRAMIRDTVRFCKEAGREVIYDAEHFFDGFKDEPEYALSTLAAALEGGADFLVLCETNGGSLPHEVEEITRKVQARFPGAKIGIHSHDDGGLGVANALASIRAGAVQVQGTMNGYGERTGNCNLTTVVPNLALKMGYEGIVPDLTKLTALSKFVDDVANLPHFNRAPFVGSTAFSHKGGTHVNAVQKLARSYEHIQPTAVGNRQVVLVSDMSGQDNILRKAQEMGFDLKRGEESRRILDQIKQRENDGYEYEAADASFELLLRRELGLYQPSFKLLEYHTTHRQHGERGLDTCEATVKIELNNERIYTVEEGDGPVNALDQALRKALATAHPELAKVSLCDFKVRILDSKSGTAAKTRVLIESTDGVDSWGTVGVDFNIIDASWEALRESLEFYLLRKKQPRGA